MDGAICKMHTHLLRLQCSRRRTFFSDTLAISLFLLLLSHFPTTSHAQCSTTVGCFPPIGNLAIGRTIHSDSQCSDGDSFCLHGTTDCSNTCNPSIHSTASINDGNTGTAWISTIGPNGTTATLRLDFEEPVLFDGMSILWKSPRPQSMVLERSHDNGGSWEAYRYYSSSCQSDFGMMPMITVPSVQFPSTTAVCTASQSSILGNTNEEVTFATSEHLPPGTSATTSIAYTQITNLRVRLLGQFDLGPNDDYQYYAVGEWVVNGNCMCNGHASTCSPAPGETLATDKVYTGCMCEHNTQGTHCERCERGFNAVQWRAGTDSEANACQRCECNGHADNCTSENPGDGTYCLNCTHNTEGENCEMCLMGYYENPAVLFTDPNICIDCDCDTAGVTDSGECSDAGQCNCKANVTGMTCFQCVDGYWNLTANNEFGCQECECDPRGTVQTSSEPVVSLCDQVTGVCQCLENVNGDSCNGCDDEFYSLDDGCLPCGCSIAASTSPVCDKDNRDGQCPCLPNVDTPTCTTPLPGYYFRFLDHELFEAEEAELSEGVTRVYPEPGSGADYSGRGLVMFPASGTATFYVQVPRDYRYELILRIQPPAIIDGVDVFIESQSPVLQDLNCSPVASTITSSFILPFPSSSAADHIVLDTVCMVAGVVYSVQVQYLNVENSQWMLDSLLLLPDVSSESAYYAEQAAGGDTSLLEMCLPRSVALGGVREECRDIVFALSVEFYGQVFECNCTSSVGANAAELCATYGGQCSCLGGVTGLQCDVCMNGWFNLSDTGCEVCGCDTEGASSSVCDVITGQCDCQPFVDGLTCDNCTYGNFNLTTSGCTACSCSEFSTSAQCSDLGQCPCTNGIGGSTCDACLPEYYNISTSGCTACNCSSIGVRSSSNTCDSVTGQCPCIGSTVSRDCSQCPEGFFETNNPDTDACIECVCSTRTNVCRDDSANYQAAAVQSDFTQMCAQDPVNCSDGWQLLAASGVTAAPFGPSDANGLGYILLSNDNPMLYAPNKFLGNQQASYSLDFAVSVSLSSVTGLKQTTSVTLYSGPLRLVGVFPPPAMQQDNSSFNTILTYSMPLMEDYWHVNTATGPLATFFQLYSTLTNLTGLSFSAEFRQDFIEFVYVQRVLLPTRVPLDTLTATSDLVLLNTSFPVELCTCPVEYAGRSCELCARGYARPSGDIADPCVECNCNNLSLDCDVDTAECTNCSGNSEGDNCELCQSGYYGDPTRGMPCLPCQCPTQDNSFSPTCFLDSDLNATCDSCSPGYTGRNCELCMDGFFGNPLNGNCITCECNGNVDPGLGPVCDTDTGRCLNCLNNTLGVECQFCQPGYYGDPPSDVPCTPCECHPNGTLGTCSSFFGTCTCVSDTVTGVWCDECRDGYWGLSQGLPCVPCDCCTNGSISNICDKETGQCDCHDNVGSQEDDKCCSCTPGFFDFTPDGCRACGCSELSVSEECNITSGQCKCQEGAVGLKCDDCAFGFTGVVPDCAPCHPCYLQWYDQIQLISEMVAVLQRRADFLVDGYYNGYTVETIEADVQGLLAQLAATNATLQNISLGTDSVQQLRDILLEINETLDEMDEVTKDTELQLTTARQMLQTTAAFDGTINQISIEELVQEIVFYDTTIASLVARAQQLLTELQNNHVQAVTVWTDINTQDMRVHSLLANASLAEAAIVTVESLLPQLELQRYQLRQNLSHLSVAASDLVMALVGLNNSVVNASRGSSEAYTSVQELMSSLTAIRAQTDSVLILTRQLNASIDLSEVSSQRLVENTSSLLDVLNVTQQAAQDISEYVAGLHHVGELITRLDMIKRQAERIFNISLPSLEYAEQLARSINASIIPDEQVQDIAVNATASYEAAQQALELARNASETVRGTQLLINQLNSDLNSTEKTQQRVEESLTQLSEAIDSSTEQLEQVRYRGEAVNSTYREVQSIVRNASSRVDSTAELAMELQNRSRQLKYQAMAHEQSSLTNADTANHIVSELADIQVKADARQAQSVRDLHNATNILTSAQQLRNSTNQVTLQQLQEVLSEYVSEREAISELRERVGTLEVELRNLTSTFTQSAQTLSDCYKTP